MSSARKEEMKGQKKKRGQRVLQVSGGDDEGLQATDMSPTEQLQQLHRRCGACTSPQTQS